MLPKRPSRNSTRIKDTRVCYSHQKWVRGFACAACGQMPGDRFNPIQAAHVRLGTGGGTAMKPSDRWLVPLCDNCHIHTQHARGERTFWNKLDIDPKVLATDLAKRSPHWPRLKDMP